MPIAAKAFFVVTAGIIPQEPIPELCRQWGYTSRDYEADKAAIDGMAGAPAATKFEECQTQALEHARGLIDPRRVNWVRLEFIWV